MKRNKGLKATKKLVKKIRSKMRGLQYLGVKVVGIHASQGLVYAILDYGIWERITTFKALKELS